MFHQKLELCRIRWTWTIERARGLGSVVKVGTKVMTSGGGISLVCVTPLLEEPTLGAGFVAAEGRVALMKERGR